jgi:hypothetical protein
MLEAAQQREVVKPSAYMERPRSISSRVGGRGASGLM